jgi:hypothetical protein
VESDCDKAVEGADVVMTLRLQNERMNGVYLPSLREFARLYGMNERRMKRAKPDAIIMHPGPINRGVEIAGDVADSSQSVILEQVTNGVAVRMALLYLLLGGERREMIVGLDHVQIAAPHGCEEEARAFYGELLGLREVPKPESWRRAAECGLDSVCSSCTLESRTNFERLVKRIRRLQ